MYIPILGHTVLQSWEGKLQCQLGVLRCTVATPPSSSANNTNDNDTNNNATDTTDATNQPMDALYGSRSTTAGTTGSHGGEDSGVLGISSSTSYLGVCMVGQRFTQANAFLVCNDGTIDIRYEIVHISSTSTTSNKSDKSDNSNANDNSCASGEHDEADAMDSNNTASTTTTTTTTTTNSNRNSSNSNRSNSTANNDDEDNSISTSDDGEGGRSNPFTLVNAQGTLTPGQVASIDVAFLSSVEGVHSGKVEVRASAVSGSSTVQTHPVVLCANAGTPVLVCEVRFAKPRLYWLHRGYWGGVMGSLKCGFGLVCAQWFKLCVVFVCVYDCGGSSGKVTTLEILI